MAETELNHYAATKEFVAECPECYERCWWCSYQRWFLRKKGCVTGHCEKVPSDEVCRTCDGTRKVLIRQTIHKLQHSMERE